MRSFVIFGLLLALALLPAGSCRPAGGARSLEPLPPGGNVPENVEPGTWGGNHVQMQVAGDGATIQFDCAHGSIAGTIPLDAEGRYSVEGLYTQEHGGPVGADEQPVPVDARYEGQVTGDSMTLILIDKGTGQKIGVYALTFGTTGFIIECL
jgi:hypothetical protein